MKDDSTLSEVAARFGISEDAESDAARAWDAIDAEIGAAERRLHDAIERAVRAADPRAPLNPSNRRHPHHGVYVEVNYRRTNGSPIPDLRMTGPNTSALTYLVDANQTQSKAAKDAYVAALARLAPGSTPPDNGPGSGGHLYVGIGPGDCPAIDAAAARANAVAKAFNDRLAAKLTKALRGTLPNPEPIVNVMFCRRGSKANQQFYTRKWTGYVSLRLPRGADHRRAAEIVRSVAGAEVAAEPAAGYLSARFPEGPPNVLS